MKRVLLILLLVCVPMLLLAQSNKRIKELEQRRSTLQKQIAETEELLKTTNKNVGSQLNGLNALTGQIEDRRRYIDNINNDLQEVDSELVVLDQQLDTLKLSLEEKKRRYEASLKYLYKNHSIQEKLMFIFSAETLSQTYNRLRYVREYATYQRLQGNEIIHKQAEVTQKQEELQSVRDEKIRLLAERASEKRKLEIQEQQAQKVIKDLRSRQKGLQDEIKKKRREANQLKRMPVSEPKRRLAGKLRPRGKPRKQLKLRQQILKQPMLQQLPLLLLQLQLSNLPLPQRLKPIP